MSERAIRSQAAPVMRDFILLYINGTRYQLSDFRTPLLLSDFLRDSLGLTGTKVVCGEGACGACSVLIGSSNEDAGTGFRYHSANACLYRLFQLDRCHIVTVEGLKRADDTLSTVQQAVVQNHGTQCGYCTPGIVISLTAMSQHRETDGAISPMETVRDALSGNLCRCTGYLPIQEAGLHVFRSRHEDITELYPVAAIHADFQRNAADSVRITGAGQSNPILHAYALSDALAFLSDFPHTTIIAGGTGVLPNPGTDRETPTVPTLSIGSIRELFLVEQRENTLFIGATVTWAQLRPVATTVFPELGAFLARFGSPQIRNQGTIGGSVAQLESNSDWLPLLLVQNAIVHLASAQKGERLLPFGTFLSERGAPDELLTGITIPLPPPTERLRLYKVTRRQAFDRSVFCAAVTMHIAPEGTIRAARIACGGVGPRPQRLPKTEQFLAGASYTAETMRQAGIIAATEIAPITDAYADAEYRRQLAARLLLRFYHENDATHETGTTDA